MFRTVPLSIIRSFSLHTQQWYMSYRLGDSLQAGSGRNLVPLGDSLQAGSGRNLVPLGDSLQAGSGRNLVPS